MVIGNNTVLFLNNETSGVGESNSLQTFLRSDITVEICKSNENLLGAEVSPPPHLTGAYPGFAFLSDELFLLTPRWDVSQSPLLGHCPTRHIFPEPDSYTSQLMAKCFFECLSRKKESSLREVILFTQKLKKID